MKDLRNSLQESAKILKNLILDASRIRITTHKSPDGDALGSLTAFAALCSYFQKEYDLILDDEPPSNLLFLPHISEVERYDPENPKQAAHNELTDLVVFLDCGQCSRAGFIENSLSRHQKIVNIDHHHKNPAFGDFNIIREASSTAELLALLISLMGVPYSKDMAVSLYTGIMTDTGSFIFEQTKPSTYRLAATLLEMGINPSEIHKNVNLSLPLGWYTLVKHMVDKLQVYCDGKVVLSYITIEDVKDAQGVDLINHLLPIMSSVGSVEVYVLVKEKGDGSISASLRSKKGVDVSAIAALFGGGGHKQAAACRTEDKNMEEFLEDFIPRFLKAVQEQIS